MGFFGYVRKKEVIFFPFRTRVLQETQTQKRPFSLIRVKVINRRVRGWAVLFLRVGSRRLV